MNSTKNNKVDSSEIFLSKTTEQGNYLRDLTDKAYVEINEIMVALLSIRNSSRKLGGFLIAIIMIIILYR